MTSMVTNHKPNAPTIGAKSPPALPKTKTIVDRLNAAFEAGKLDVTAPKPMVVPPPPPNYGGLLLDVAKIFAWPDQPRKRFPSEEKLRELGDSMIAVGQLEDILVRPHATKKDAFEIVFGECRWRAAKLVGMKTLGAKRRELTDAQALEIAVVENMHRNDVHALEEAEGFEQMMKKHGVSADDLAVKVKKSREYVYTRLKLLALTPNAREAFYADRLSSSTALYIARIPTPELQMKAIDEIEHMNARDAAEHVRRHFMLKMVDATFDTKDPLLVEAAGACAVCPKRTKNAKEVFGDVKGSDLCTDPTCFKSKSEADASRRIEEAKKAGVEVLTKTVETYDYASNPVAVLDVACQSDPKGRTYRELLKSVKEVPPIVLGRDRDGRLVEAVKRDAVTAALATKHNFARELADEDKKDERRRREYEKSNAVECRTRELAVAECVKVVERRQPKAAFYVAVIVALAGADTFMTLKNACEKRGLGSDPDEALESIKDEATLRGIIAELICGDPSHVEESGRAELFEAYGVEEKSFEKGARASLKADAEKPKGKKS